MLDTTDNIKVFVLPWISLCGFLSVLRNLYNFCFYNYSQDALWMCNIARSIRMRIFIRKTMNNDKSAKITPTRNSCELNVLDKLFHWRSSRAENAIINHDSLGINYAQLHIIHTDDDNDLLYYVLGKLFGVRHV